MKVAAYAADEGACGALRIRWPAQTLAAQGRTVTVDEPMRIAWTEAFAGTQPPAWVHAVGVETDADVCVFQRPLHAQYLSVFPALQAAGVRVVVDLDDHFDAIDRGNRAWVAAEPHWLHPDELAETEARHGAVRVTQRRPDGWAYTPDHAGRSHRLNLQAAVTMADAVTVSTPALAAHYSQFNPNITVVPNRVPRRYLTIGRTRTESTPVTVGWTGSTDTHPRDLQVMGGALALLKTRAFYAVVGTGIGVERACGRRPDHATGWVDLTREYPRAYSRMDVAVCPLRVDAFNQAKSALKPLEAAALGVVPVMSPTDEYLRLHGEGVGLIATRPKEWVAHLDAVLSDRQYRAGLAAKGLDVAARHTIEEHAGVWWDAWTGKGSADG